MTDSGRWWCAQLTVQHHWLRIGTIPLPHRELRIVAKDGADTNENAIVQTTQLMRDLRRFGAAKIQGFAAASCDAAIPALGIGQCNKGSIGVPK